MESIKGNAVANTFDNFIFLIKIEGSQFLKKENMTTIQKVLLNPCTSYWLKDAIHSSLNRDILDAIRDAKMLAKLLNDRWQEVERDYLKAAEEMECYGTNRISSDETCDCRDPECTLFHHNRRD